MARRRSPFTSASIDLSAPPLENTERNQFDLRGPYLEALRAAVDIDLIRRATLTLFVDPMNGTTSGYIPAAIGEGGQTKAIEINREIDPLFGRQSPQPSESGLNRLRKLVKESDSHLGVALSADGRALSVADSAGELVTPLDLTRLLASYLSRQHRQRGLVVGPLPPEGEPASLRAWADEAGLKVESAGRSGRADRRLGRAGSHQPAGRRHRYRRAHAGPLWRLARRDAGGAGAD